MVEGVEKTEFKTKIYTLRKGTTLFSGAYPEYGEIVGHVNNEKGLKTSVITDQRLRRTSSTGWIFFQTNHTVDLGQGREVDAWVAKMPGIKGFVKI